MASSQQIYSLFITIEEDWELCGVSKDEDLTDAAGRLPLAVLREMLG
jgi:hypothetical protein